MTEQVQTVVFIRHGVARHNIRSASSHQEQHNDASWIDPGLTEQGRRGAVEAGRQVRRWLQGKQVSTVVVSPLTRCLQTATLAFVSDERSYDSGPVWYCHEDVREACGKSRWPDRRRCKTVLQRVWPAVNFLLQSEEDSVWRADRGETWAALHGRVETFLGWLCSGPHSQQRQQQQTEESVVVVVTHGVWMECLLRQAAPNIFFENGDDTRRVYNCDAYACQVVSSSSDNRFLRFGSVEHIAGMNQN